MSESAATVTIEDLVAHAAWARRLAAALVGEPDADDLVQETWLESLRRGPTTDRPLGAWLRQVLLRGASGPGAPAG